LIKLLAILTALFILVLPVYAQDTGVMPREIKALEGHVESVDWVGSMISVNGVKLYVPPGLQMSKGGDTIGLDDINVGDPVTVTYYDNGPNSGKVVSIRVEYYGDFTI
jgi:hypothetical protein